MIFNLRSMCVNVLLLNLHLVVVSGILHCLNSKVHLSKNMVSFNWLNPLFGPWNCNTVSTLSLISTEFQKCSCQKLINLVTNPNQFSPSLLMEGIDWLTLDNFGDGFGILLMLRTRLIQGYNFREQIGNLLVFNWRSSCIRAQMHGTSW